MRRKFSGHFESFRKSPTVRTPRNSGSGKPSSMWWVTSIEPVLPLCYHYVWLAQRTTTARPPSSLVSELAKNSDPIAIDWDGLEILAIRVAGDST